MKRISMVVIAVALTMFGISGIASAQGGGTYPVHKAMVGPGKAVIGPNDTVGVFAWKFCENKTITIKVTGPTTVTKTTQTNDHGSAVVFVSNKHLGTYIIKATACGQTAYSKLTVKSKKHQTHYIETGDNSSLVSAFSAVSAGMNARSAAVTGIAERPGIPALPSSSSSEGLQVTQLGIVALLCAAGIGGVAAVRRRSRSVL